ncbi:MAG: polysaccharide biosynthesis/export family protein [Candidatus Acidiferrales bacterium]|jgi:polysaccharide export outer membrane protein
MTKWGKAGTMLLLTLLAIPLAGQQTTSKKAQPNKPVIPANADASKPVAATTDPGYVIGAEDVLNISVWKEPEVTRTVPVRPDGKISLPLINDIQAAGLTPAQLTGLIMEKLNKYFTDPQVTVIVTAINSRRIYILGEVNRSGTYQLLPNMTVLQALSGAGGFSQFANLKGIYVLREENGKQIKFPFNYKEVIKGNRPEQNILLKPGDTIVVP